MKSLILMGFAACVVVPMTWTVDAQQNPCKTKNCGPNEECRLDIVIGSKTFVAECVPISNQRIVGGSTATYGDHPYICSLQFLSMHACACVIWNNEHVVTAAHCLIYPARVYRVKVGIHNRWEEDTHQASYSVSKYTLHPNYINKLSKGVPNDIAVVKLKSPIVFNAKVNKVTFATSGSFVGQSCVLAGWGHTSGSGNRPNELQSVNITAISKSECTIKWSQANKPISDGHICFYERTGQSACSGDSGGPAVCGQYMTGITSWGIRSCNGTFPSVYTRVSHYNTWLVKEAGSN